MDEGYKELWAAVGENFEGRDATGDPFKSRKGFGYRVRQARARPGNTSIRDLLSDDRYTEVLRGNEGGGSQGGSNLYINAAGLWSP